MTLEALQKNFARLIRNRDVPLGLWLVPMIAVAVAFSRLVVAHLNSRLPQYNYNFDLVHHWPFILQWFATPQRLLMLSAFLFATLFSLVALSQKNKRLRVLLFVLTLAGTLLIEWSADYVVQIYPSLQRPRKADPGSQVDFKAAMEAYKTFGLDRYAIPELLIATEIYYEQRYVQFKDVYIEDKCVSLTGETPLWLDVTIGPAQMKKSKIVELVTEFPSELKDLTEAQPTKAIGQPPGVSLRAALSKRNAAMLVGAYNASVIRRLEKGDPACPNASPSVNQTIAGLWNNGDASSRVTALAMAYCPYSEPHGRLLVEELKRMERWYKSGKFEAEP